MVNIAIKIVLMLCCLASVAACSTEKPPIKTEYSQSRTKAYQRPYIVNGTRYEPLSSHVGFVQFGIASWYGRDFLGRKTSNGEKYDMNAMTAAHKTLPLGVFVKIRNTENGNEVIVRVNDRGPFVKGRIIDLSYAAAKKLGLDVKGTAPVRIEALGYRVDGEENYRAPNSYDAGNYSVQVGSFKDYSNARRLCEEMKKHFGFSEVHTTNVHGDDFYRVYAGKYPSLHEAESAEREFSDHGFPGSFTVSLE